MLKEKKELLLTEISERLQKVNFFILTDFTGLDAQTMTGLRRKLRECDSDYQVVKNTLLKIAITDSDKKAVISYLEGPTGIILPLKDPVKSAKALFEFKKDHNIKIKVAFLKGKKLIETELVKLSELPSERELKARMLSVFQAVPTKLVIILGATQRKFLNVLTARVDSQKAQ